MGTCQPTQLAKSGTFEYAQRFRDRRDRSAPKKPIFDDQSYQSKYSSQTSHYQFRVSQKPQQQQYPTFRTTTPQRIRYVQPVQQAVSYSCPQRIQQQLPISIPRQQLLPQQPQQPQQLQQPILQRIPLQQMQHTHVNNITFSCEKEDDKYNKNDNENVEQLVMKLSNHQQKLFKATSNAILSIRSDKLDSEDQRMMNDIFNQLGKSSFLDSKGSSKKSLNDLQCMYEQMNEQLNMLNSLINCLDNKINSADREKVKNELGKFTNQVQQLGEQAQRTIKKSKQLILKQSTSSCGSVNVNNNNNSKLQQPKSQLQQPISQLQQPIYSNKPQQESISNRLPTQSSALVSSQSLTSDRMRQNNQKMDNLINKLQDLNMSYRRLGTEDYEEGISFDLSNTKKHQIMNLLNR